MSNENRSNERFEETKIWNDISRNVKLDEEFIEKYQDKVNWKMIINYQILSAEFVNKFLHKGQISIRDLKSNNKSGLVICHRYIVTMGDYLNDGGIYFKTNDD